MCGKLPEALVGAWFKAYCDLLDAHRLWTVRYLYIYDICNVCVCVRAMNTNFHVNIYVLVRC